MRFALLISMQRLFSFSAVSALAVAGLLSSCATVATNTSHTFETVVVDAGHGGKDSGAWRRYGPPEKMVALDVALRVDRKLRESQLKTALTRSNDVFIPLDDRVAFGNAQKNSIFVSIHFNDSRRRGVQGFETYYHSPYAYNLAAAIERNLSTLPGTVNRGVHTARFRVLRNAQYPSVLVECGYLSNRSESRDAASADYREELADKIAEAIVDYRYGEGVYRRQPAVIARAAGGGASFLPSFH
jgi:N-acetylmuramoyl-L-alanine amidase